MVGEKVNILTGHGFPKSVRLVQQREFDRVHAGDVFAADEVLVIKAVQNATGCTRMGLSIGKKVGNAVRRNRWKRLIRESFRRQLSELPHGLDIVVRPRKGAACEFDSIYRSLGQLLAQIERRVKRTKKR